MAANHIGRRLKQWRIENDLPLRAVAEKLGVSEGTIHKWEAGKIKPRERKRYKIEQLIKARAAA